MRRYLTLWIVLAVILALAACGGGDSDDDNPQYDGDTEDGDVEDGDITDGDVTDGDITGCPTGFVWNPVEQKCEPAATDGDVSDGDVSDGDVTDGDTTDGDTTDGDITDGDVTDGDVTDGDTTDGDTTDGDVSDGDVTDGDVSVGYCPSATYDLIDGVNNGFPTPTGPRDFTLVLPNNIDTADGPWPVVFFFYGSGGNMPDWVSAFGVRSAVNSADFPFIGVVPKSLMLMPPNPVAFDWDSLQYDSGNPNENVDVAMVGAILGCLREAFPIDENHIHAAGFSAGAFMANLSIVAYPDDFASVAAFSGAYFSDPNQVTCVLGMCAEWTPYTADNIFPALVAWGSTNDTYNLMVMTFDFAVTGQASVNYLTGMGHDVVQCTHNYEGHVYPTPLSPMIYDFFKDHPYGMVDSPYAAGLPNSMTNYCTFVQGQ